MSDKQQQQRGSALISTRGLFKRKDSPCWWIRYADENGRIVRMSTDTENKALAKTILDKKRTLVAEGKHLDIKKLPNVNFGELCQHYWDTHGKTLRMKGLANLIEIWKEGLGKTSPLKEITQKKIENFLSERTDTKELKPATRNRHLTMLKSVFNKAVEWGMLFTNPAAAIKNIRENGARTRFLSTEEIDTVLSHAGERFKPLLIMALHTGMRRGEILKLKWVDVDFVNRIITIQESKSGKKRMIPMDETLTATLHKLPSRFKKGLVFPTNRKDSATGEATAALTDTNHTFVRLCEKAKIDDVRFHDLRHTFASHLVMNGVDLKTVQELLGHASINMTLRYSHLAPTHQTKAVKVLDSAYLVTGTKTDTVENSAKEAAASPLV